MAQRSITSFFAKTPKKSIENDEQSEDAKSDQDVSPSSSKSEDTPKSAAKKNSSKRQRIESSGSESKSPTKIKQDSSPVSTDRKSKVKRPRIESSDSDPPSPASPQKITVKVEKHNTPAKTYASPKTKKNKVQEERKKEATVKKEKTPLAEKNKVESKSNESKRKIKSPTPKKEKVVKTEDIENDDTADKIVPEEAYNPSKERYHPIKDACWPRGKEVPYLALAKTLEAIEGTSARLKMIEILSNYFRSVIVLTPEDLLPSVYMCLNQLAPAYHSMELGIAETYLMKAIGQCTGRTLAQVKAAAQKTGDLGLVAEQARATQRTMFASPPLKLRKVFAALKEIAHMTGHASVNKKISKIQSLYVACRYSEARYLIRSLAGKLRIGLAEQSVLQALSLSTATTPPGQDILDAAKGKNPEDFKAILDENALIIKTTYCECPNYDQLIPVLLAHGVAALPDHCKLTPGVPLKPMLAHPTKGVHEVFNRFEGLEFTCEYKYDGERAQIHVPSTNADVPTSDADVPTSDADMPTSDADVPTSDAKVPTSDADVTTSDADVPTRDAEVPTSDADAPTSDADAPTTKADLAAATIFSRNQENNTSKYPDILRRLPGLLKESVQSCVLDCESVAFDVVNKQILPFQILSTRKRKDANESDIKVQVCVFVFDLLYLNGRALVKEPFSTRRRLLYENFNEVEGEWQFATAKDCSTIEEVQLFLDESVKGSCEGLMVKTLKGKDATYEIARRSRNWLKLKKDYLDGVGDSLDVVVIGGYSGRGKRTGVYGGFLLACYDPDAEEYQSLCKIGTGFTDEDLQTLSKKLEEHVIDAPRGYYRFDPSHSPDSWFAPAAVWEVRCADLSLSPAHRAAAGAVEPGKGISLRFPRFIRERDDKTPEQATSAQQVAELYLAQDQVKNQTGKPSTQDDFY